jgi:hypothetical protein
MKALYDLGRIFLKILCSTGLNTVYEVIKGGFQYEEEGLYITVLISDHERELII